MSSAVDLHNEFTSRKIKCMQIIRTKEIVSRMFSPVKYNASDTTIVLLQLCLIDLTVLDLFELTFKEQGKKRRFIYLFILRMGCF